MQEYRDRECQDTVDGVSAFLSACVVLRGKGKTWTLPLLTGSQRTSQRDERQMAGHRKQNGNVCESRCGFKRCASFSSATHIQSNNSFSSSVLSEKLPLTPELLSSFEHLEHFDLECGTYETPFGVVSHFLMQRLFSIIDQVPAYK